jgi:hypothetical protein
MRPRSKDRALIVSACEAEKAADISKRATRQKIRGGKLFRGIELSPHGNCVAGIPRRPESPGMAEIENDFQFQPKRIRLLMSYCQEGFERFLV